MSWIETQTHAIGSEVLKLFCQLSYGGGHTFLFYLQIFDSKIHQTNDLIIYELNTEYIFMNEAAHRV